MTTFRRLLLLVLVFYHPANSYGYDITALPFALDFDGCGVGDDCSGSYSNHVQIGTDGSGYTTGSIESLVGYGGGGAYKLAPEPDQGNWGMGVGFIRHDFNFDGGGGMRPGTIHVRILMKISADYWTTADAADEFKSLIMRRCNSDCSAAGADTERVIALIYDEGVDGWTPRISENIGTQATIQGGFGNFNFDNYADEWVCIEYEADLNEGVYRVFIDTQDGLYTSESGTTPYAVLDPVVDTSPAAWHHISRLWGYLMGFQEHTTVNGYDPYYLLDELIIDDSYIGPPAGFTASTATILGASGSFSTGP